MDSSPREKPVLVFDGDCSFCRLWIGRWHDITGDSLEYEPYQKIAEQFPQIPRENFARSVQLILPSGESFSAAHAVFRSLASVRGWAWMLWLYLHLPGFAPATEAAYRFVARNRNPLYRLTRIFWGRHFERPSFSLSTWIFLRLLGLVYFFAFLSLALQIPGLIGHQGILPASEFLQNVRAQFDSPQRYWYFPTLAWLDPSDAALRAMGFGGALGAVLLIFDFAPIPLLSLLWLLYLSLTTAGQDFLGFQWDALLLEAGFLAVFLAPARLLPRIRQNVEPPRLPRLLLWFLLFRLTFSSGVVKLTSGDLTWHAFTALNYHYFTQPLPTPIAWYMHLCPTWFQRASVGFVFFVELIVPFLIFLPRLWRFAGAGFLIFLQLLIALTGNYAFFNLLTVSLCVLLFDDALLERVFPPALTKRFKSAPLERRQPPMRRWLTIPVAAVILICGLYQMGDLLRVQWLPVSGYRLLGDLQSLRIVNSYGLFANMTTERPEIVIEGSNDGETWQPYEFKYKMGDVRRAPRWVEPFQPRLDWQMWFAALGDYRQSPWFSALMLRVLQGSPPVVALFERNPFPQAPPTYLRAVLYDYQFTNWKEREETGNWWRRSETGIYFPVVSLK
jgi:predicted DCC family thiol-disulfide oxidoreductase YuxK